MTLNLRIFSWNYGHNTDEKQEKIMNYITEELRARARIDIFVIGLQEVHSSQAKSLGMFLKNKMSDLDYTGTVYQQGMRQFTLFTAVFLRQNLEFQQLAEVKHTYFPSSLTFLNKSLAPFTKTKGALSVFLSLIDTSTQKNYNFIFCNVHLPFNSEALTKSSVEAVLRQFQYLDQDIVVFGDFNSRSLFDDDCDRNETENCEGVEYKKNIDVEKVDDLEIHLNTCKKALYGEKTNLRSLNCASLSKNLQSNDLLLKRHLITGGFTELPLFSLPSYKIDEKGEYTLEKNHKGRLAGFADRIIFSEDMDGSNYKMLPVTGNDHFPISLALKNSNSSSV